ARPRPARSARHRSPRRRRHPDRTEGSRQHLNRHIVDALMSLRLWYHAGCMGAPAIDAKITTRLPSGRYTSGVVRCWPDLAPTVVTSTIGADSNGPPTLPLWLRNSSMTFALKSLMPIDATGSGDGRAAPR